MIDKIVITVQLYKEDEQIVAFCPQLNVSSFGDTVKEAKKSLIEAVSLFLEECQRIGTLHEVLEEAGYHLISKPQPKWVPPSPLSSEELEVAIA